MAELDRPAAQRHQAGALGVVQRARSIRFAAARSSIARSPLSLVAASTSARRAASSNRCTRRRNAPEIRAETSNGAPSGTSTRSLTSGASSSIPSGLPAVASWSRRTVAGATSRSSADSSLLRPPIRSVGRSAPSSSDGSPSRTATSTAIGSATNRRKANSSAWALEASSQWASSMRTPAAPARHRRRAG